MDVSVVVPVHNSAATLHDLVTGIRKELAPLGGAVEVVLVDDASADGSWDVISDLARDHSEVQGVRLARNVGEQNAVLCGVLRASHPVVATIDDDLQQPPSALPELVAALTDDVDLVYGVATRYEHGPVRQVAAVVTKWALEHVFRVTGAGSVTSFRVFRASLRGAFPSMPGPLCSVDGLLWSATTRVAHVEVDHRARQSGRSQYTPAKLVAHTMSAIVGGSTSPLLIATATGLLCLLGALGGAVAAAVDRVVLGGPLSLGWLAVCVGLVVGGVGLVSLGILGEYAARILLRAGGYPAFVVAESTCDD